MALQTCYYYPFICRHVITTLLFADMLLLPFYLQTCYYYPFICRHVITALLFADMLLLPFYLQRCYYHPFISPFTRFSQKRCCEFILFLIPVIILTVPISKWYCGILQANLLRTFDSNWSSIVNCKNCRVIFLI